MRQRRFIAAILGVFVVGLPVWASSQTVDELIAKNIEAMGGYKKWKSIQSMKITGLIQTQGMEMPFVRYAKRPNLLRIEATMQGQTMIQAYDGKTPWWIFPFMGSTDPQKMPPDQAEDFIQQADFDGPMIDYQKKGHKIELAGKEEVEGTEAYKLKITLKNGQVLHVYLDPEYYLEIKQTTFRKSQGTEFEVETYFGDYKEVEGILLPHSIQIQAGIQKTSLSIEKVEFNVEMDDSLFTMPDRAGK